LLEHFVEPQVRRAISVDLSFIEHYDRELKALERYLEANAQAQDPVALAIVRTVHGIGVECAGKGLQSFPGRRAKRADARRQTSPPASDPR
jgi:transposase